MSLLNPDLLLYSITLLLALLFSSPPSSCAVVVHQRRISSLSTSTSPHHDQGVMDEKTRLGSTPPSCYNRCHSCNPCIAVQVPTLPTHNQVKPGLGRFIPLKKEQEEESLLSSASKEYTNYKPLEWKCRCGSRLFNP